MYNDDKRVFDFVNNETQFHLGFLPTEQSNPKTRNLSQTIECDIFAGIDMILSVDEDIAPKAAEIFNSCVFEKLIDAIFSCVNNGGRVFLSGCGATGRLAILLDAAWRRFWRKFQNEYPEIAVRINAAELEQQTVSIMTGGERALIRSVENFEDFVQFGRQQMIEKDICDKDMVIAITEGGETSSVIGTAWEGVDVGAEVFFVFNNPAEILTQKITRSCDIICHPRVTAIDLSTGPMSIAGSTRMQATTSELLVIGAAIDEAIYKIIADKFHDDELAQLPMKQRKPDSYVEQFDKLLKQLRSQQSLATLAEMTEFEEDIYSNEGLVTYLADEYLIDIMTDTTERAPTFMLPPFRPAGDNQSVQSWAFVKNPLYPTERAWRELLQRPVEGLAWTGELYKQMNAPAELCENPPKLGTVEICSFMIGSEDDSARYEVSANAAVYVLVGADAADQMSENSEFRKAADELSEPFNETAALCVGPMAADSDIKLFNIVCDLPYSPMELWSHLALKLTLNTISTATMTRMGRVLGNWMVYVETSNKKLFDRAARLIQQFTDLDYKLACGALFETLDTIKLQKNASQAPLPPTIMTIERINSVKAQEQQSNDEQYAEQFS